MSTALICNRNNLALSGVMANNFQPSKAVRRVSSSKTGAGNVSLQGEYTGAEDAQFEIEITSNAIGGQPVVSEPVQISAGNGEMLSPAVDPGTPAQTVTVTLKDLGTQTLSAYAPLQSVTLKAKASGEQGNNISLTVDRSGLQYSDSEYACHEAISAGESTKTGQQWDFGAVATAADGSIPSDAPRIAFDQDPHIYRQYKTFVEGQYHYHFSPELQRDVAAAARVKTVTGSVSVSITDGTTSELYQNIISLYDLLNQLTASALVSVEGVVSYDVSPAGMAILPFNLHTESYAAGMEKNADADLAVTISATAPTENLTIQCKQNAQVGAEIWSVTGSVSGALADAVTGVAYQNGPVSFTVPIKLPDQTAPAGSLSVTPKYVSRKDNEEAPPVCVATTRLGALASNKSITFRYQKRPSNECNCENTPYRGGPNDACLGIENQEAVMGTLPAELKTAIQSLYTWQSTFIDSNTEIMATAAVAGESNASGTGEVVTQHTQTDYSFADQAMVSYFNDAQVIEKYSAMIKADRVDIDAAKKVASLFHKALRDVYDALGSIPPAVQTAWDTAFADMQTDFTPLAGNVGADWWRTLSKTLNSRADIKDGYDAEAALSASILKDVIDTYIERYKAQLTVVLITADIEPDFDRADILGTACWQDTGDQFWWVAQDVDYLPIFNNTYYHSARRMTDGNGEDYIHSTSEFGFALKIACEARLKVGDSIDVVISNVQAQSKTYVPGDNWKVPVIYAGPVQFGGGQTGDDLNTWRVESTAQNMPDYSLDMILGNGYSANGLSFEIQPGGIPFELGDQFQFDVEGGQFRWRKSSSASLPWQTADIAESVSLSDGLNARFDRGASPSFELGDHYVFEALAINAAGQSSQPVSGALKWLGATEIDLSGGAANCLFIADHSLPAGTEIVLEGSDDGFVTKPLSIIVPWSERSIGHTFESSNLAEYRLKISQSGQIGWLFIGEYWRSSHTPSLQKSLKIARRNSVDGYGRYTGAGYGASLRFDFLNAEDEAALQSLLTYSAQNDQGRLGLIANTSVSDSAQFVRFSADGVSFDDFYQYQSQTGERNAAAVVTLEAVTL